MQPNCGFVTCQARLASDALEAMLRLKPEFPDFHRWVRSLLSTRVRLVNHMLRFPLGDVPVIHLMVVFLNILYLQIFQADEEIFFLHLLASANYLSSIC